VARADVAILQRGDAITAETWDVRLDAVCTERATYLAGDPA
jgi:5-formyltetrahydrofolate cyclo-ligase